MNNENSTLSPLFVTKSIVFSITKLESDIKIGLLRSKVMRNVAIRNIVLFFDIIASKNFSYIPRYYISGNLFILLDPFIHYILLPIPNKKYITRIAPRTSGICLLYL